MKMGLHEEGSLSLRLKIDYTHDNPTLRDPHIYRIRYTGHPHCGNKWCIYPLYDFTHCIIYLIKALLILLKILLILSVL
jgi:glutaminyl-tRNA synthetase